MDCNGHPRSLCDILYSLAGNLRLVGFKNPVLISSSTLYASVLLLAVRRTIEQLGNNVVVLCFSSAWIHPSRALLGSCCWAKTSLANPPYACDVSSTFSRIFASTFSLFSVTRSAYLNSASAFIASRRVLLPLSHAHQSRFPTLCKHLITSSLRATRSNARHTNCGET